MSIITKFLKLFEYDPETDGASTFNIPKALNENWDKIDAWASGIKDTIAGLVPSTRKINKKPLSADVTLTGEDIKVTGSDDTTIHTRLSELSNPNLLDNWYFVGGGSQQGGGQFPINQRGQISANTPGLLFFDRWKLHRYVSGTATLTVNGLDLVGDFDFGEIIESNRLPGTPNVLVTISVLLSDGTLKSKTSTLKNNGEYEFVVVAINPNTSFRFIRNWGKANLGLDSKKSNIDLAFFNLTNGDSVFPIAVKLELGSQQTLAHLENGKWVLNEIPDYGEQLAKCQRYYCTSYQNGPVGAPEQYINEMVMTAISQINFSTREIQFPQTMRTTPAITFYSPVTGNVGKAAKAGGGEVDIKEIIGGENRMSFFCPSQNLDIGFEYYVHYSASADL